MKENLIAYLAVLVAVIVVAWAALSITGMVNVHSEQKFQEYEAQRLGSGSGCGDLGDIRNIQHLSHHPDRFADCIKQVDEQKFHEAVGESKEDYIRSRGI